jgi:hypothetical protein
MYYNHNLRTNLQEWKNRLYRGTYKDFGNQLKYFFSFIETEKVLMNLLNEACTRYPLSEAQIKDFKDKLDRGARIEHDNLENQAASPFFTYS